MREENIHYLKNHFNLKRLLLITAFFLSALSANSQQSVARIWNEAVLEGIRNDFARPTVHARNLFHTSVAMYDAWAAYEPTSDTYLLGRTLNGYSCAFEGISLIGDKQTAQEEAMSYAVYRIMLHRFANSPGVDEIFMLINNQMDAFGYDKSFTSIDYSNGSPAALGNYIAQCIIEYGLMDRSNEANNYENQYYSPTNESLIPASPGNPNMTDPNRWQPLTLEVFIDQSGNIIPGATPEFLGPEWGNVFPFSLNNGDLNKYERDGNEYWIYHDPSEPPYLLEDGTGTSDDYKWTFSLVSKWSSHLDPTDGVMWDISPGASGNVPIDLLPTDLADYPNFYNELEGGDPGTGRSLNPVTNAPYEPNIVPRGDYTRVLAEFWADGPDSETPPGHWFTILNYVSDQPELVKKFKGEGDVVSDLEWDVKSYFILGGTMHDCAISAWGIKGWYDYTRPISAIRYMADQGQSSDPNLPNYSPQGIPLEPGYIELVEAGDPLAILSDKNIGKIKLKAWKGPDYIADPAVDEAGVDWILAENWWPYQRPSFITPPFAGYVSGHSTFSRAAAEILTLITGDEYFPGGMGEFHALQNDFLVFEEGPSVDVTLQWATYRDASDQTSLSRIWGGIHPPADDIRGRIIGYDIAFEAFNFAERFFNGVISSTLNNGFKSDISIFPNPANDQVFISGLLGRQTNLKVIDMRGAVIYSEKFGQISNEITLSTTNLKNGVYLIQIENSDQKFVERLIVNH